MNTKPKPKRPPTIGSQLRTTKIGRLVPRRDKIGPS